PPPRHQQPRPSRAGPRHARARVGVHMARGGARGVRRVDRPPIKSAQAGFESVDHQLEQAARTLGRSEWSVFWSVTLPLAWRSVLAGAVLAFCRALGEFGITLMVAGNIPGRTQTLPLAIYDRVQAAQMGEANELALIAVAVVVVLLFGLSRLARLRY